MLCLFIYYFKASKKPEKPKSEEQQIQSEVERQCRKYMIQYIKVAENKYRVCLQWTCLISIDFFVPNFFSLVPYRNNYLSGLPRLLVHSVVRLRGNSSRKLMIAQCRSLSSVQVDFIKSMLLVLY